MDDKDLILARKLMVKILEEVHTLCVQNDIKYFLHFGSLIGAVRHNGFIPWDDDVDIGMLRPDYEKFCKIAPKKLGNDFFLQTYNTDDGYGLYFSKVILLGTVWQGQDSVKTNIKHKGLCIDVFPFDKVPASQSDNAKFFSKCSRANVFTLYKFKYREQPLSDRNSFLKKILIRILPKSFFIWYRNRIFLHYRNYKNKYLITGLWNNTVRHPLPEAYYKDLVLHTFENKMFFIPKHYHEVLTAFFGDYMQIPPVENRPTHNIIEYDFGKFKELL